MTSLIVSLFTFFLLAQSCSSPSIQKFKVKCLCTVLSFLCFQPRKAIYCFISSLPINLGLQKNVNQRRGARNWSLNIFGSQLNHESPGLDSKFSKCLLNEYYVQTAVCLLRKHPIFLLELTFQ